MKTSNEKEELSPSLDPWIVVLLPVGFIYCGLWFLAIPLWIYAFYLITCKNWNYE